MDFGKTWITREMVEGQNILEVGSYNVNGSLREYVQDLKPLSYTGVDFRAGPGVDAVMDFCQPIGASGDPIHLIICTEMLEHAKNWPQAVRNIKTILAPGGVLILTTRSIGFPLHEYPGDYWRFSCTDMRRIFRDFDIQVLTPDWQVPGVFILAQKPKEDGWEQCRLEAIEVYPMDPHA